MTKHFVLLVAILFADPSISCVSPRGGAEYDQLIQLEKLDAKNQYKVTVPKKLENLKKAEITLTYSEAHSGGILEYVTSEVLKAKPMGKNLTAKFTVEKRDRGKPHVVVMWWPKTCCPCGIRANTKFLEVE